VHEKIMNSVKLNIQGMTCGHCTAAVEKALMAVEGVEMVEVTLEPGGALVKGSTNVDALIHAVEEEGYEAQLV
jgi:copper chaperone